MGMRILMLCVVLTQIVACDVEPDIRPGARYGRSHGVALDEDPSPPVVVESSARFESRDDWVYLVIADTEHRYEIMWAFPPDYGGLVKLKPSGIYTFTVEERLVFPGIDYRVQEVIKVESNGRVIYDREVCEVHQTRMEKKRVPVWYGYIVDGPGEPSRQEELKSFPHRREYLLGGCVSGPESPQTALLYMCDDCKAAYDAWKLAHPSAE